MLQRKFFVFFLIFFVWGSISSVADEALKHNTNANENIYAFSTEQQEKLFKELTFELRCPKCQNQNLMDSGSEISLYMKNRIHKMVLEGDQKEEIVKQLRQRYGDFITYKPPFNFQTAVLWLLPLFLFLGVILFFIGKFVAKRNQRDSTVSDQSENQETHDDEFSSWLANKKESSK